MPHICSLKKYRLAACPAVATASKATDEHIFDNIASNVAAANSGLPEAYVKMEQPERKANQTKYTCCCEICRLHPHLSEALLRMKPPELRLYSHAELLELLECDISTAGEKKNKVRTEGVRLSTASGLFQCRA